MTYAPDDLLAVRRYLMLHTGLDAASLGIAGDPAHAATGGYHEGNDDLAKVGRLTSDYSKRESPRDRPGSNAASALDVGDFQQGGRDLRELSTHLVRAAERGDPRARDLREIIYTPDGHTVARWDALGIRSTGDNSHLYHTHLSFFRDSEGRRDKSDNILGLLAEFFERSAMDAAQEALVVDAANITKFNIRPWLGDLSAAEAKYRAESEAREKATLVLVTALSDAMKAGGVDLDTAAVVARIDALAEQESQAAATAAATIAKLRDEVARLEARLLAGAKAAADALGQ